MEVLTGVFIEKQEFYGKNAKEHLQIISKYYILKRIENFMSYNNTLFMKVKQSHNMHFGGRIFKKFLFYSNRPTKQQNDLRQISQQQISGP